MHQWNNQECEFGMFSDFLKGYVIIRVWGPGKERFLTLCGKRHMVLQNIRPKENEYYLKICRQDFSRIPELLEKTCTEAALVEKHGLPFLLRYLSTKQYLIWGVLLGGCIAAILNCFIWSVEFGDLQSVTEERLERELQKQNISFPVFSGKLDCNPIKENLRKDFPELSWVSVSKEGCRLVIRLKEENQTVKEKRLQEEMATSQLLRAREKGVIVSMITRIGTPVKKEGDAVEVGDVLVDGDVVTYEQDGSVKAVHHYRPDADVVIEHLKKEHILIPQKRKIKEYEKGKTLPWIRILGKEYSPISFYKNGKTMEVVKEYKRKGSLQRITNLFDWGFVKVYPYIFYLVPYSDEERNELIQQKTDFMMERMKEKGVSIRQKNVTIQKNKENWDIVVNFILWTKQSGEYENSND